MDINIRTKVVKIPEDLTEYINEKLKKSEKYFSGINRIDVFLSKQKYRHIVEIVINIAGNTMKIKHQAADFRSAFDITFEKIEQQLRKEKDKMRNRRKKLPPFLSGNKYQQTEKPQFDLSKKELVPAVSSVEDAVKVISDNDYAFWVFINGDTNKLSLIYKKPDSSFGLFEIKKRR